MASIKKLNGFSYIQSTIRLSNLVAPGRDSQLLFRKLSVYPLSLYLRFFKVFKISGNFAVTILNKLNIDLPYNKQGESGNQEQQSFPKHLSSSQSPNALMFSLTTSLAQTPCIYLINPSKMAFSNNCIRVRASL